MAIAQVENNFGEVNDFECICQVPLGPNVNSTVNITHNMHFLLIVQRCFILHLSDENSMTR